jgi:hypothetical protein
MEKKTRRLRIEKIWAYIAVDSNGNEGICGFISNGRVVPMIGADEDRIKSLEPLAQELAKSTGCPIKLVSFSNRIEERELWGASEGGEE